MEKSKTYIQIIILAAILAAGGMVIIDSLFSEHSIPKIGDKAPDFTLQGLDGKMHQLSDYKGKTILITFWGTFCPPCVREMPAIQKQYEKYSNQNFVVLGVNLDENKVTVESFIKRYHVKFPILMDQNTIRRKYGVSLYPTSFFVNSKGEIVDIVSKEMNESFIESRLLAMMSN